MTDKQDNPQRGGVVDEVMIPVFVKRKKLIEKELSMIDTLISERLITEDKNGAIRKGNGHGFIKPDGSIAMQRCFECGRENYAIAVFSGICAWCGHDANEATQERK